MAQKHPRFKLITLAVIFNMIVLAILIGIALFIIHIFLQGKLTPSLISIFASIFFVCAMLTTSLVYRFYMRHVLKIKNTEELFIRHFKKNKKE